MDARRNESTTDEVPPRPSQVVLCTFAVFAVALLAYKGYGNASHLRPTEHQIQSIRYRVDLNQAERSELLQVPGIGPRLTDAILSHRRVSGPFAAVEDLVGVKGIGGKTVDKLRPWVKAGQQHVADPNVELLKRESTTPLSGTRSTAKIQIGEEPIDINNAEEATLLRLPGIGPTLAGRIVVARGLERFRAPDDLGRVKGIGSKTLNMIRPYVVCK